MISSVRPRIITSAVERLVDEYQKSPTFLNSWTTSALPIRKDIRIAVRPSIRTIAMSVISMHPRLSNVNLVRLLGTSSTATGLTAAGACRDRPELVVHRVYVPVPILFRRGLNLAV